MLHLNFTDYLLSSLIELLNIQIKLKLTDDPDKIKQLELDVDSIMKDVRKTSKEKVEHDNQQTQEPEVTYQSPKSRSLKERLWKGTKKK